MDVDGVPDVIEMQAVGVGVHQKEMKKQKCRYIAPKIYRKIPDVGNMTHVFRQTSSKSHIWLTPPAAAYLDTNSIVI